MMSKNEPLAPRIDYEEYIATRAREYADEFKPFDSPKREAQRRASLLEAARDRFNKWAAIGNLYADVLESPRTSSELHNAIHEELDELEEAAGNFVCLTKPALIRMLYPWMRDLAEHRTPAPVETNETEDDEAADDEPEDAASKYLSTARHLSAVLKDPATPGVIREAIYDGFTQLNQKEDNSPSHIAFMLAADEEIETQKTELEGVSK